MLLGSSPLHHINVHNIRKETKVTLYLLDETNDVATCETHYSMIGNNNNKKISSVITLVSYLQNRTKFFITV